MSRESTCLAAEFFVLSILHRLGMNAHVTLGHHKAVDIVVVLRPGKIKTIDVKGAATVDWFVRLKEEPQKSHFYVFVAYKKQFNNILFVPEVYVVPSSDVHVLIQRYPKGGSVIRLKSLSQKSDKYKDAWHQLH